MNRYGIYIESPSSDNSIYHNNLIDNTQNAYDDYSNTWYNEILQQGNYWNDFDEPSEGAYDIDSDGIADSPYNIPGGNNQDRYPLMVPYPSMDLVITDFSATQIF